MPLYTCKNCHETFLSPHEAPLCSSCSINADDTDEKLKALEARIVALEKKTSAPELRDSEIVWTDHLFAVVRILYCWMQYPSKTPAPPFLSHTAIGLRAEGLLSEEGDITSHGRALLDQAKKDGILPFSP